MKRTLLAAGLGMVATAAAAQTEPFPSGLYTVANYEAWWPTYQNGTGVEAPRMLNGFDVGAGWRFNRYYAVEASYFHASGSSGFDAAMQGASVDALGYLPFGRGSRFALYADAGASELWATASLSYYGFTASSTTNRFGAHAGGGAQYQLLDDLGLRLGARYQWASFDGVRGATVASLGLVWHP